MPQPIHPSTRKHSRATSATEKTGKETEISSPRIGKRSSSPEMEHYKQTLSSQRRSRQLETLDEIAVLTGLEGVTDKKGPGNAVVRKEISLVAQAWKRREGEALSTRKLLDHSLRAVSESTSSDRTSAWSQSERLALHTMQDASPAVQRGQLAAMALLEKSGLMHATPDAAADALRCLRPRTRPRAVSAEKLLHLLKRRAHQREKAYNRKLNSLRAQFVLLGEEGLLKPSLEHQPDSSKRLEALRAKGQITNAINLLRKPPPESEADPDFERYRDTLEKLDRLEQEIQQCISDAAEEAKAMNQFVIARLREKLPSHVLEQLAGIQAEPNSEEQDKAVARILRRPLTRPEDLVASLKDDAQLFEALQILWGGAPLTCISFARSANDLLALSKNPDKLWEQLEQEVLARLSPEKLKGYPMERVRAERARTAGQRSAKKEDSLWDPARLIADTVKRIHTPPTSKTKKQSDMVRKGYAVKPDARPYQRMLDLLDTKRVEAVDREAQAVRQARADEAAKPAPRKLRNRRIRSSAVDSVAPQPNPGGAR